MDEELTHTIATRYRAVQDSLTQAALRAGRNPADVKLLTVTKLHPLPVLQAALQAGIRDFGENYPEEAASKMQALASYPDLRWHMIGHIQSRKADLVTPAFHLVHSLDSLKLAQRLQRYAQQAGQPLPVLLECNVSGEASKYGFPAHTEEERQAFFAQVQEIIALPHLQVRGLMTMPPLDADPEQARPYFIRLRQLRDALSQRFPAQAWEELSMGTSADFQAAVEEGATLVRVGTAILGARPPRR